MAKVKLIEATELYPEKNDIVRWNKMETADDIPFVNQEPQQAPQQATAPAPTLRGRRCAIILISIKEF